MFTRLKVLKATTYICFFLYQIKCYFVSFSVIDFNIVIVYFKNYLNIYLGYVKVTGDNTNPLLLKECVAQSKLHGVCSSIYPKNCQFI